MFCPNCGSSNTDVEKSCTVCGSSLSQEQYNNNTMGQNAEYRAPINVQYVYPQYTSINTVSNYMVFSIINIILACLTCNILTLILSIIAVTKSNSVNTLFLVGNHQGAVNAAKTAKTLNIIALILSIAIPIIIILLNLLIPFLFLIPALTESSVGYGF